MKFDVIVVRRTVLPLWPPTLLLYVRLYLYKTGCRSHCQLLALLTIYRYAREEELCTKASRFIRVATHSKKQWNKCKTIFTKMLKDVGIEVPKSIETRSKFSMHAGDDSMQQS